MRYKSIRGMSDILPRDTGAWRRIEQITRLELESSGYKEIRTPILEDTAVFKRSIGETTDIVTKEMYTFSDRKGRALTLRPEGTAPVVRAYIENALNKISPVSLLYYIGPMFRSERPQKGRSRQFHQIGIEIIGSRSPQVDGEVIYRLNRLLGAFGLTNAVIKLNSLGCRQDKAGFTDKLKKYLRAEKKRLCEDCKKRIEKNAMRVLDCKNESCLLVIKNAPKIIDSLCDKCLHHFSLVKAMLRARGGEIDFQEDHNLVRGLDYYTGPVFEVTHPGLGGQDALAAGGRYDNLVKEFGGPDTGAAGFAIGIERLMLALGEKKEFKKPKILYIATLGDEARSKGLLLAERLKQVLNASQTLNCVVLLNMENASLKAQMRSANRENAKITVILGADEIKSEKITIKDMESGEQVSIEENFFSGEIKKRIGL